MSLEYLISKYIDGELTSNDDKNLREMIKDNSYAKEKFDRSVELHLDLKEDRDSIKVPSKLLRQTEEAVLMKIMAQTPATAMTKVNVSPKAGLIYRISSFAAVVTFFALATLFYTTDSVNERFIGFTNNSESAIQSNDLPKSSLNNTAVSKNTSRTTINEASGNSEIEDIAGVASAIVIAEENSAVEKAIIDVAEISLSNSANDSKIIVNESVKTEATKIESPISMQRNLPVDNSINQQTSVTNALSLGNTQIASLSSMSDKLTSVQFNTIISRDFARLGLNTSKNTPIISVSQSIGYNVGEHSTFGMEFGMMDLQYDYTKNIPLSGKIETGSNNGMGVNEPIVGGDGTTLFIPVTLDRQEQLVWGMAFYETRLFTAGDLSLTGRLGIGATTGGPLALSRMTARYSFYRGVSLTLGAEGRMFMFRTPQLINPVSTVSNFGLVYGIQFNL